MPRHHRIPLLVAAALLSGHAQGTAPAPCVDHGAENGARDKPTISLRVDNDIVGAQDQGYSNGIELRIASADLPDPPAFPAQRAFPDRLDLSDPPALRGIDLPDPHDPPELHGGGAEPTVSRPSSADANGLRCRWPLTAWLARRLRILKPAGATAQNLSVSLSQVIFTPKDRGRADLIRSDRPYAAALLLGLGYNARTKDSLQASLLQVGIVGPSARGRQSQNEIHKLTGDTPFLGWDNQLRDEGVFRLQHERLRRHLPAGGDEAPETAPWDAVTHWGAGVGNLYTHASIGGELRWGPSLPNDFGSMPTRLSDGHPADRRRRTAQAAARDPAMHGFAGLDLRWVLRDISLDGNAFRRSHRVDKEPIVVDFGYGFAVTWGAWRMVLARFHRTREFKGQQDVPVYGSITVSRIF